MQYLAIIQHSQLHTHYLHDLSPIRCLLNFAPYNLHTLYNLPIEQMTDLWFWHEPKVPSGYELHCNNLNDFVNADENNEKYIQC